MPPKHPEHPIEVRATPKQPLGMSPTRFLRDYWQKRPLLIRRAFPDFSPPLTPDDLAGLACMEGALARIVQHTHTSSASSRTPRSGDPGPSNVGKAKTLDSRFRGNDDGWKVRTGPFNDDTFAKLPESHWTLLVQDVDKWDADTASLLDTFDFLPSWRIDDVMVSYATDQGGVGAHVDQYDVFLLQGLGQRQWCIDTSPDPSTAFRDDVELKLLRHFNPTHAWTLQPGDMLYLPPGVPHDGVAVGECMTFSIGMRAPSQAEMLTDLAHALAFRLPEERRYTDADLAPATQSGEIDAAALRRVRRSLGAFAQAMDDDALADWFGRFITRYRSAMVPAPRRRPIDAEALATRLQRGKVIRDAWSRFAWRRRGRDAVLFASGDAFPAPLAWARTLAGCAHTFDGVALLRLPQPAQGVRVLQELINAGHLRLRAR